MIVEGFLMVPHLDHHPNIFQGLLNPFPCHAETSVSKGFAVVFSRFSYTVCTILRRLDFVSVAEHIYTIVMINHQQLPCDSCQCGAGKVSYNCIVVYLKLTSS